MNSALIGYTGFVGSNLAAAHRFDDLYNSGNIDQIAGTHHDLVVSAANRADSFRINADPAPDREQILAMAATLSRARIDKLVLISTVCVYPAVEGPDEDTAVDPAALTPYGRHRLELENMLRARFDTTVLRLPQLYGRNLRKGIVYDLLHDYRVEHIDPNGAFQYYGLRRLWSDIQVALNHELDTVNLATPPLVNRRVAREVFGIELHDDPDRPAPNRFSGMYTRSMTSRHADLFGGADGYLLSEADELAELHGFVQAERAHSTRNDADV
jgi:hypothetical protein